MHPNRQLQDEHSAHKLLDLGQLVVSKLKIQPALQCKNLQLCATKFPPVYRVIDATHPAIFHPVSAILAAMISVLLEPAE